MNSGLTPTRGDWGCTGCACAFLGFAVLAVRVLNTGRVEGPAYTASCMSNLKQSTTGLLMYAQDYDSYLPPAGKWHDGSTFYIKDDRVYTCPLREKQGTGYAFNQMLSGRSTKHGDPEMVPLLFESGLGQRNGADGLQSFVTPHHGRGNVSFLDGHVRLLTSAPSAADGLKEGVPLYKQRDAAP